MDENKNTNEEFNQVPKEPKAKFDIYTGKPIEPETNTEPKPKFDIYTGKPIEENEPKVKFVEETEEPKVNETASEVTSEPAVQTPQQSENQAGEYRYIPPYQDAVYRPADTTQVNKPYESVPKAEKKKKEKKGFTTGAIAIILAACVILSLAAGAGGALVVSNLTKSDTQTTTVDSETDSTTTTTDTADTTSKPITGGTTANLTGDNMSTEDVVNAVASSVVEVEVSSQVSYGMYQYVQSGAGSGVIVSEDGYIITNAHVVVNETTSQVVDSVLVRTNDGTEYSASLVGYDSDGDIALLKVEATGLNAAVIGDSDSIVTGQDIILIGNPLGQLGGTVTKGIISATGREIEIDSSTMKLIQIDAAANPGNSGGGLFNMKGELVGILNSGVTNDSSGTSIDGISFCIPSNDAMKIANELKDHGYVSGKVYLGISVYDVTDMYTAYYNFRSQATGLYVTEALKGYNDDVLQYGDRITAVGDKEITSTSDLESVISNSSVGDILDFTIVRDGKIMHVNVECFEYVPSNITVSTNK